MTVRIRKAVPDDVEAIRRSLENMTVLVADDEGSVVGTGNIDLRSESPVIWKLYVVPEAQGRGVGSALIEELVGHAGDRPVRLEYTDGNTPAAGFYAAHGFVEIRREPNEHPGWPDAVWVERQPAEAVYERTAVAGLGAPAPGPVSGGNDGQHHPPRHDREKLIS